MAVDVLHENVSEALTTPGSAWAWVRARREGKHGPALGIRLCNLTEELATRLKAERGGSAGCWHDGSWQWEAQGRGALQFMAEHLDVVRLEVVPR